MKEPPPLVAVLLAASLALSTTSPARTRAQTAQDARPASTPAPADEETVVRIDANLVQVDAVVTDKEGRQVTDLKAGDFEILEDGRPQQITNFSYVSTAGGPLASNASTPPASSEPSSSRASVAAREPSPARESATSHAAKDAPPAPASAPLRREQVRRTVVLVVDDLGLSFTDLVNVRAGIRKFVEDGMQPGDLAAIVTTSGDAGDLRQLTGDRQALRAAVERLRWQPVNNRVGIHPFGPDIGANAFPQQQQSSGSSAKPEQESRDTNDTHGQESLGSFYDTLSSLRYIVAGLRGLPGRKSVFLFTDDLPIIKCMFGAGDEGGTDPLAEKMTAEILQASNHASVVFNAVDARGLATTSPTAAESGPNGSSPSRESLASGRWLTATLNMKANALCSTQQSLQYLAQKTGGLAVVNTNDFAGGVRRVMDDLAGYYLIGYRPPAETFEKKGGRARYHKITLRVKRPGLHVRTREGFFGDADGGREGAPRTMPEQLAAALDSPFAAAGVRVRMTALFGNTQSGSFLRLLLHVDPRDLTFRDLPDGWHETKMDVLATSFGGDGSFDNFISRTDTVRARGRTYERLRRDGLDYDLVVAVKNPGSYQLRAAVRDSASARIGTAYQYVEVPDLKKGRLALSGVTLAGEAVSLDLTQTFWTTAFERRAALLKVSQGPGPGEDPEVQNAPAVRRFRRGEELIYRYTVYNARGDSRTMLPRLHAEARLFRDGQLLSSEETMPLEEPGLQLDPKRVSARGRLVLREDLAPGQYVLQLVVTDQLSKGPEAVAWQSVDFEIVK
jgi:VWFA-related protein